MNPLKYVTVVALLASAAVVSAAVSDIQVTVARDPGGPVAYKGKLDARGNFATSDLPSGSYTVVFKSNAADLKDDQLSVRVIGGKQKMAADGVEGSKLTAGGVGMKIALERTAPLAGNIVTAKGTSSQSAARGNPRVKIMNGTRYYWMRGETGSNIGGRWVEENEISPSQVRSYDQDALRNMQSRGGETNRQDQVPAARRDR